MDKQQAQNIIRETFENSFDKSVFTIFIKNLLNHIDEAPFTYQGNYIPDAYKQHIKKLERIGKYSDGENKIDILIATLQKEHSLERARTMQRNFIAWYLNGSRGGERKDAALVAFISPNEEDWRFSLVKMDYKFEQTKTGKVKVIEEFTPARRWSFLVGTNERSHTAQSRFLPVLQNDETKPIFEELEAVFSVEKVTKEFFEKYRDLFHRLTESLDDIIQKNKTVKADFTEKNISTTDFAKKLLGQIVFLYFLQKKGWFGVPKGKNWGEGNKQFLRHLYNKSKKEKKNFFNDYLEPLFYQALRYNRSGDDDYFSQFDCKIPFLNGGLFDPMNDYDWINVDIPLASNLFSNEDKTKEGDIGDGILDIFDRYNFTVKEDEPLEKDVAIDPEMLGKVFENLLEVKDRKSKGTYYTPREIVHYMCQESLSNYLETELYSKVSKEDIKTLIEQGESAIENDSHVTNKGRETQKYVYKLPQSVRMHAQLIDEKLVTIRICDPAVGSGAFPVGMMNEIIRIRKALTPYMGDNRKRTSYNFKRQAIQSCLYGVDIDHSAVEITKLRLWLSLVVDEEDRRNIQPLPNLDYKIVQGNSLLNVEKNVFNYPLFNKLEDLKPLFFNETDFKKKKNYKLQIDELIKQITNGHKDFDFEVYFSEVFHEKKGFDVVIANPPYVDSETMVISMPELRKVITSSFVTAKGNWDLYIPFWELGVNLLNNKGNSVFITPNKWLAIGYGNNLRELLRPYVYKIGNCDNVKVFEAGNSPVIVFISKVDPHNNVQVDCFSSTYDIHERLYVQHNVLDKDNWGFLLSRNLDLILKLMKSPNIIKDDYFAENPFTVSEAYEVKKILYDLKGSEQFDTQKHFKFVNTGTIEKYYFLWSIGLTTYLKKKYNAPVINKDIFKKNHPRRFNQMCVPKIVISGMRHFECVLDPRGEVIAGKSTVMLKSKEKGADLTIILSILNSSLITFFIREAFGVLGISGGINFTANLVENLPLPKINDSEKRKLKNLVDEILIIVDSKDWSTKIEDQTKVCKYEQQIDQLVYKLYGLRQEEISIIEGSC
jgi:hypothetical protein